MKKIAWLLDQEPSVDEKDTLRSLFEGCGGYEIVFAPLANQPIGQKHRYPSDLTPGELETASSCDEIIIERDEELTSRLLGCGKKPLQSVWESFDCSHERCNYRELTFLYFHRVMDDSMRIKMLVPKGTDLGGSNPENFEVVE